ncbi:MAG: GAF domain-containing protein, partial [Pseudolabrys sp.]
DVLKVISRSTFNLQTVLDTLVESSSRLCDAYDSIIFLRKDDKLYATAHYGPISLDFDDWPIDRNWVSGRAFIDRAPVQVEDAQHATEFPVARKMAHRLGFRTTLSVPLLRQDEAIGAITIRRSEVEPFTEKQIELVKTFADQAVIAIENVRLFEAEQQRSAELAESLEEQTATAEALKVISRSNFDLQVVLDTLTASIATLCHADMAGIVGPQGDEYYWVTSFGYPPAFMEFLKTRPILRDRGSVAGRALVECAVVHVADLLADAEFTYGDVQRLGGYRTVLGVPLMRGKTAVGVILLTRRLVDPFTEKQIELVRRFSDQAVIAIENVRLFEAEQQRTAELAESLEQQTATSEILQVISNSPTNTQPVFDVIVQSALRLFPDGAISIALPDGDKVKAVASNEANAERAAAWRAKFPIPLTRQYFNSVAILDSQIVDIPDVRNAPPDLAAGAKNFLDAGYLAVTTMPMMRGAEAIGALSIMRTTPGALTDKQLALVKTFAAQAVIAIENARLFNELRERTDDLAESLEQQTATSEVLKVISSSPGDLEPVFHAMLENATRICSAEFGFFWFAEGESFRAVATHGVSPALAEERQRAGAINFPPESPIGRVKLTKQTVHVDDIRKDAAYLNGFKPLVRLADIGGARTLLIVPMLKENELIGVVAIYRKEVRAFSDK